MEFYKNLPDHYKYGLIVGACVFFVGWSTRLGGGFIPNVFFAVLMGLFAGFLFGLVKRKFGGSDE
ncbi:MAG: hypothetical protein GY952_16810 [Rhodobacteraceae bacterium]|nr:hypothetical protein [Paracoccaceae bacterium]